MRSKIQNQIKKTLWVLILCVGFQTNNFAQDNENIATNFFTKNIDFQIRAQFSIGGSSPLGMPVEIRRINSYNPTLQLGLEANATKWFNDNQKLGLRAGLRFEGRGMKTDAKVKNYLTQIDGEEGKQVRGYFTGNVKTNAKNTYVTFPISLVYNTTENWNIFGGVYLSALIDKDFTGYVYDGVLRDGDPIGNPIEFEAEARGNYDFSENLNRFQWGAQFGTEWKMNNHFRLFGELDWGLNGVFKKDFDAISFKMYSIYLNLGFAYQF